MQNDFVKICLADGITQHNSFFVRDHLFVYVRPTLEKYFLCWAKNEGYNENHIIELLYMGFNSTFLITNFQATPEFEKKNN